MPMERPLRTLLKTVTWRIAATAATVIAVLIITRRLDLAFGAGLIDSLTKSVIYYFHERAWTRIRWGLTSKVRIHGGDTPP